MHCVGNFRNSCEFWRHSLEKLTEIHHDSGVSAVCANYDPNSHEFPKFPIQCTRQRSLQILQCEVLSRQRFLCRRIKGNMIRGNRTESLREENPPPRGSPRGPPKTSESLREVPFCDLVFITSAPLAGFRRHSRRPSRRKSFLSETLLNLSAIPCLDAAFCVELGLTTQMRNEVFFGQEGPDCKPWPRRKPRKALNRKETLAKRLLNTSVLPARPKSQPPLGPSIRGSPL